jgi:hypothetical protein
VLIVITNPACEREISAGVYSTLPLAKSVRSLASVLVHNNSCRRYCSTSYSTVHLLSNLNLLFLRLTPTYFDISPSGTLLIMFSCLLEFGRTYWRKTLFYERYPSVVSALHSALEEYDKAIKYLYCRVLVRQHKQIANACVCAW